MKEEKMFKVELGFKELCLIEKALELYARVGMLQLERNHSSDEYPADICKTAGISTPNFKIS